MIATGHAPAYEAPENKGAIVEASRPSSLPRFASAQVVTIGPTGTVVSPWTPVVQRDGNTMAAFPTLQEGTYQVMLVGANSAETGEVTVRALGLKKTFPAPEIGSRTVANVIIRSNRPRDH